MAWFGRNSFDPIQIREESLHSVRRKILRHHQYLKYKCRYRLDLLVHLVKIELVEPEDRVVRPSFFSPVRSSGSGCSKYSKHLYDIPNVITEDVTAVPVLEPWNCMRPFLFGSTF